ncbi:MAG: hypothetical protein L6R40_000150 [Gallowayella cf. fulva]|nr:MAG: hypothetical protein L6R40_000150 [Xanthomendoza cf. fulva]
MGLVDYSESEGSEPEQKTIASKVPKATTNTGKPAFQKVVDRSDPHKIRVHLPEISKEPSGNDPEEDGPPAKKARVGGGAFSGFNSFLPAPQRTSATAAGAKRGGLGSGVNLKTGAAPGFSREPVLEPSQNPEKDVEELNGDIPLSGKEDPAENITSGTNDTLDATNSQPPEKPKELPKKQGTAMMFKPLSVARKPQKKKAISVNDDVIPAKKNNAVASPQNNLTPKVSLFATDSDQLDRPGSNGTSNGTYQPLIYGASENEDVAAQSVQVDNPYTNDTGAAEEPLRLSKVVHGPQSLDTIASDLNLSASAKRQLLGRQNRNASAINVVNFNTDREYAANELLRQAGETVQHNPVRAIAPGKHSLKQLVNAASNQKEALEEQFASGRRNKKEAGSKYGW